MPQTRTVLLIGTRKGLWIGRSDDDRETWTIEGPQLPMEEVAAKLRDGDVM